MKETFEIFFMDSIINKMSKNKHAGLEINIFCTKPNCIFKSHLKVNQYIFGLPGTVQKFEGAAGEFKGALGFRHPLISSPGLGVILP